MKKTVLILLFIPFFVKGQGYDSLFVNANKAYQSQQYERAIGLYDSILDQGVEAAAIYYNLGNAYYKSHNLSQAILNYERARLLDPGDEDIEYNLELARSLVVDKLETIPVFFLKRWYHAVVRLLWPNGWALLSLSIFLASLVLFLMYLFSGRYAVKKTSFWVAVLFLIFSVSTYAFARTHEQLLTDHGQAIITQPSLTAKSTPDENGTNLFVIHEGLKVSIEDEVGEWREIKLSDGNKGWVRKGSLERI